jgi:hypothetical protein
MTLTVKDIADRTYQSKIISTDQLNTENHGQLSVEVEVDTLEMATIRFGNSFTLRINEFNIDELRSILFDASRTLAIQRSKRDNPSMHISNGQNEDLDVIDDENDEGIDAWQHGSQDQDQDLDSIADKIDADFDSYVLWLEDSK